MVFFVNYILFRYLIYLFIFNFSITWFVALRLQHGQCTRYVLCKYFSLK